MKLVKVSEAAVQTMCEHATSLFYDKQRKSSFYFNWEYKTHFEELIDIFASSIPDMNDMQLSEKKFDWFRRQCKVQEIDNLHLINVHSISYGGLWWHAFYTNVKDGHETYYVIWHFSYSS